MLMKLTTGDWNNQSERMNMKVDEENCKSVVMVNGRYWKRWQFSALSFGLGGSRLWEKEDAQNIIGKKKKTS